MPNRHLRILIFFLLLFGAASLHAGKPELRTGTLKNGLTYYICHNDAAPGSADFFIARKVGSLAEGDSQRGMAHFLEHMCFNGSEHFPGNSLISYLESLGVKFGANLNAYTSTDETVYNISKVPVSRESVIDSTMLILYDWSCALTLADKDIEAERGIIVNEWRQRNNATNRMLERAAPRIFAGSKYGHRLPIGKMEIVENFKPQELRDFYRLWYHPSNEAIIIVGDIDIDKTEKKIKKVFGRIPAGKSGLSIDRTLPDNERFTAVVENDKEQGREMLQMHYKHDLPTGETERLRDEILAEITSGILVNRFDRLEAEPDCPYTNLGIGDLKFLVAGSKRSLMLRANVKPGKASEALKECASEIRRATLHGFTDEEFKASLSRVSTSLAKKTSDAGEEDNTTLARNYARCYLDNTAPTTPAEKSAIKLGMLDTLTAADAETWLRSVASPTGRNLVAVLYQPDREQTAKVSETELAETFAAIDDAALAPYAAPDNSLHFDYNEPVRGSIVSTDSLPAFGAEIITLSNGIKVYALRTDYKTGQVYVRGFSAGGLSQEYSEDNAPTMKVLNDLMPQMKYGGLTSAQIRRGLLDTNIRVSTDISNTEETVEASCTPGELTEALRLINIYATCAAPDTTAFHIFVDAERDKLRGQAGSPVQTMGDSIHTIVYSRHPLGKRLSVPTLEKVDLHKAMDIYRNRFADMSDFSFIITGDFEPAVLRDGLERYIASLPAGGRSEKPRDIGYRYITGQNKVHFSMPMETPQPIVYKFYNGDCDYSLGNILSANIFGQIAKNRLMEELRENRGWTYSVKAHCSVVSGLNGDDAPVFMMPVYIKVSPDKEFDTASAVDSIFDGIASQGSITDAEMTKAKEYLAKAYAENSRDNAYWLAVLKVFAKTGLDLHNGYMDTLNAISADDIRRFANEKIRKGNHTEIILSGKPNR